LDGHLASVQKPSDVGRVRGLDLCDRVRALLVYRIDTRLCYVARPCQEPRVADCLRDACYGLARERTTLGALRDGLSIVGWTCDASRSFGPHNRKLRLCRCAGTGLARDHLPALFCRGRNLRGLCDGADADYPLEKILRPGGFHHRPPLAKHGEGDARNRIDRGLRLHHGSFLWMVQREPVREV